MKKSMKRILNVAIILFLLLQVAMPLSVKAETNYPTPEEAEKLLAKVPNEIKLDIKESEFQKAEELVEKKLSELLGITEDAIFCSIRDAYDENSGNYFNEDIHEMKITIWNSNMQNNVVGENIVRAHSKIVKIEYSNTKDWNQKDYEYVKQLTEKTNFNRRWDYNINADGTSDEHQDKEDFNWKILIENENDVKLDDIAVIEELEGMGGAEFEWGASYKLYILKNDIVYYITDGSKQDTARILIPDALEETDEAYINYAKPIIEKHLSYTWYDEDKDIEYTYKCIVTEMKRKQEDFVAFNFKYDMEEYINGVLNPEVEENPDYEDYYLSIIVCKENEYRGTTNANLMEISMKKVGQETYINGTLNIVEVAIGYEYSFGTLIPVVKLIDSTGKENVLEVTQKDFSVYEFKVPASMMKNGQIYKIFVESPFENNKSPQKNTYVEKNESGKTEIKSDNVTLSIQNKSNVVTLTLNKTEQKIADINGDKDINTLDAVMLLQAVAKKINLNDTQKSAADVNHDGEINTLDAVRILQFVAKKIPTLN